MIQVFHLVSFIPEPQQTLFSANFAIKTACRSLCLPFFKKKNTSPITSLLSGKMPPVTRSRVQVVPGPEASSARARVAAAAVKDPILSMPPKLPSPVSSATQARRKISAQSDPDVIFCDQIINNPGPRPAHATMPQVCLRILFQLFCALIWARLEVLYK